MSVIFAKNFEDRSTLDIAVKRLYGDSTERKEGIVIKGTRLELKRVLLSEKNTVFGVEVKCIDCSPKEKGQKKTIQRGKIHKSRLSEGADVGINIDKSKE